MKLNKILFTSVTIMAFVGIVSVNALNTKSTISEEVSSEINISGIKDIQYKLEGATKQNWTDYTDPFQITNQGITFITARVTDKAGNVVEKTSTARIGDNIDLEKTSSISGIKSVQYRLQGATNTDWTDYTIPFEISSTGITFVLARVIDNAGNVGETTSIIKIGKDEVESVSGIKSVQYKLDGAITTDWTEYSESLNLTGNGLLMIMARAIDNAGNVADDISYVQATVLGDSGINKIVYKLDGATVKDWTEYDNTFTINNKGITTIIARAYDNAGNIAFDSSVAKIGFSEETMSGIDRIEYKLEGVTTKDWTEYTGAFYVTDEGITNITARAYDKAGNLSEEVVGTVKVDKTAPGNNSIKIELF